MPRAARPGVDVVVPFRGGWGELAQIRSRLAALRLGPDDTVVVVDNTPGRGLGEVADRGGVPVLRASERQTPGFARNRGAAAGSAEWLVFVDADTDPSPDLLDCYFDPVPGAGTGLIAGGVIDEVVGPDGPAPARYAHLRRTLSQDRTLSLGRWAFAQTANVACRRAAFEAVGGFREDIWPGEDADLSYRLRDAGWQIERREQATVVHHSRTAVRAFIRQAAGHGAACAWLDRTYPGSFPPRRRPGLIFWALRTSTQGLIAAARRRDRDQLVQALFGSLWELSFEFGRSGSVHRNGRPRRFARRASGR